MKRTMLSIAAAVLCASAISAQVFAADILSDRAVYAVDQEEIARAAGSLTWEGEKVYADYTTLMPLYQADLYDFARTGNLDIQPSMHGKFGQEYIADAVDKDGNYVGMVELTANKIVSYTPRTDIARSVDFKPNARRISAAMAKQNISSDCKEVKLVFIDEVGYVYYIDNGVSKYIAATSIDVVDRNLLNKVNDGIVGLDELKEFADKKLEEYEVYKREVLDKLDPGEGPPTMGGGDSPSYMVDITPYLDNDGAKTVPVAAETSDTGGETSSTSSTETSSSSSETVSASEVTSETASAPDDSEIPAAGSTNPPALAGGIAIAGGIVAAGGVALVLANRKKKNDK